MTRNKISKYLATIVLAVGLLWTSTFLIAQAAPNESFLNGQICSPDSDRENSQYNLARCVNNIYTVSLAIGGFYAVLIFVVAGYLYAFGNEKSVKTARDLISSTIIGLILLFGAYAILNTIDPRLTSFKGIVILPEVNCDGKNCEVPIPPENGTGGGGGAPGTFPNFKQSAAPWGSNIYGVGRANTPCPGNPFSTTIGSSGCGPTAMANVLKYYQDKGNITGPVQIDPGVLATYASNNGFRVCGDGTSYGFFPSAAQYYGLRANNNVTWEAAQAAITQGYPVIASMGPGFFTTGGHFIVVYGIRDGNVLVSDSSNRDRTSALIEVFNSQVKFMTIISPR
jgi:hypothetical protein